MRLIDADSLMDRSGWYNLAYGKTFHGVWDYEIASEPTVDAVPVVFCKDCIHSISYVDKSGAIAYVVCNLDEDSDEIELRTPMDYCSYGEREEDNT